MKIKDLFRPIAVEESSGDTDDFVQQLKNDRIARKMEAMPPQRQVVRHPLFKQDNPAEWQPTDRWLQGQRLHFADTGYPGDVTGWFEESIVLPLYKLKYVRGKMNEQSNVRNDDLNWLMKHMGETNELPTFSSGGREVPNAPFIAVYPDETVWVYEGNHRIMAADRLGWEHMPVEVKYFAGAEYTTGRWSPEKLLELHNQYKNSPRIS